MGYWASFTQKALAIHGLVLLWWCVSTAWFLLLKCHYVKKKSSGALALWNGDWNQGCGINLRDLHVRRGWCENVDSPGSVCSSHEIQKELVFSSSPKLWKVTCRWGKNEFLNKSFLLQLGRLGARILYFLFLLLCFYCVFSAWQMNCSVVAHPWRTGFIPWKCSGEIFTSVVRQ